MSRRKATRRVTAKHPPSTYLSDAALVDPKRDEFNRWPFAERIASTIASRKDPGSLVIAIYGEWGAGKTTALNYLDTALSKHDHVITLRFNPWRFPEESKLISYFFSSLSETLNRRLKHGKKVVGEVLSKFARVLPPISVYGVSVDVAKGAEEAGKILAAEDLAEDKARIEEILQQEMKRVVVLMDDIDRLDKAEIQAVFKLVKLSADFAYTTYVLAFDDEMVSEALAEKYGQAGTDAGRRFMEKIVQVPLRLPAADRLSLRNFSIAAINQALEETCIDIPGEDGRKFFERFTTGLEQGIRTPRLAKQYANALRFALPLLKGEANLVDVMTIEGMRVLYPKLYKAVRDNKRICLGSLVDIGMDAKQASKRSHALFDKEFEALPIEERSEAKQLLKTLFPRLGEILDESMFKSNDEQQLASDKRIASEEYFDRYFTFSVPKHDVPDGTIRDLLQDATKLSPDEIATKIGKFIQQTDRVDPFLVKLTRLVPEIDTGAAQTLAIALAMCGSSFPEGSSKGLLAFGPSSTAAMLVQRLVGNVPQEKRLSVAEVIVQGGDVYFTLHCLYWMKGGGDKSKRQPTLSQEQYSAVSRLFAERIKRLNDVSPILSSFPERHAAALLAFWSEALGRNETNQSLLALLTEKPFLGVAIVKGFSDVVYSSAGQRLEFGSGYKRLSETIDPNTVLQALVSVFGPDINRHHNDEDYDGEPSSDQSLAIQFCSAHRFQQPKQE